MDMDRGHGWLSRRWQYGDIKLWDSYYVRKGVNRTWIVWADNCGVQRQTVVSQFYQLDRLVVEGGKTVSSNSQTYGNPSADWCAKTLLSRC